jgi:hypothetical protein
MGHGGACARIRSTHLEHDHGLACPACLLGRVPELLDGTDTLDIANDDLGIVVISIVIDEISEIDVNLVSGRRQLAESYSAGSPAGEQSPQNSAALGSD